MQLSDNNTESIVIRELASWSQVEPIKDAWEKLSSLASRACLYSTEAYCVHAWRYITDTTSGSTLKILAAFTGDETLVAILPMVRYQRCRAGIHHTVLGPLSIEDTDKFYPLILPGHEDIVWPAFAEVLHNSHWHVLRWKDFPLVNLQRQAVLTSSLCENATKICSSQKTSPLVDLTVTAEHFWQQHRKLRKAWRTFENQCGGQATFEVFEKSEDMQSALAAYVDVERNSWKSRQHGIGSTSERYALYQNLCQRFSTTAQARIGLLKVDETPIAAEISLVSGNTVFFVQGAFDARWSKFSPGKISTGLFIKAHLDQGYETGDFLAGFAHYVLPWASHTALSQDYMFYRHRHFKGALLLFLACMDGLKSRLRTSIKHLQSRRLSGFPAMSLKAG